MPWNLRAIGKHFNLVHTYYIGEFVNYFSYIALRYSETRVCEWEREKESEEKVNKRKRGGACCAMSNNIWLKWMTHTHTHILLLCALHIYRSRAPATRTHIPKFNNIKLLKWKWNIEYQLSSAVDVICWSVHKRPITL